jgi:hypothetical protein
VRAFLDDLVIALYVMVDDLLGPRRGPGRRPKLSDAELVCLAVAQVLLGCGSERRWLRLVGQRLGHLFPTCRPSAYNRRLRRAGPWSRWPSPTWPPTPQVGAISCGWSTPPGAVRASCERVRRSARWPMAAMATASATTASSGRSPVCAGRRRRAPGGLVPGTPSSGSGRWSPRCWTMNGTGCGRAGHLGRQGSRRPPVRTVGRRLWRQAAAP